MTQAVSVWLAGGWAMIAIAIVAMLMFTVGMNIYFRLLFNGFRSVREKTWRRWLEQPEERKGAIGELLDRVQDCTSIEETQHEFAMIQAQQTSRVARDLKVMKICVAAAPLLGLLGTVTGMLTTFSALASGSGGEKTMALIAKGISEALITTETGLVVALPGLFFHHQLSRTLDRYAAFLAHLESVCTQRLYRNSQSINAIPRAAAA